jgi:hypothetical protein
VGHAFLDFPRPLVLLISAAHAELPLPTYPECGEEDREDLCPDDLDGDWSKISYVPEGSRATVRPEELELGSGNNVDRAWRITTGRFDVLLAVGDSGFDWSESDFVNKIALNTDELPLPWLEGDVEATAYDTDGNGLVNVQDWALDSRVDWAAGRDEGDAILDPSDLIYTFSDGVDDDGNGYVDDIAGWDFFADDNDAYHDFSDEFGEHGDGVIEEMAAEGNNGGDIGICPNCGVLPLRVGDTFITDGSRVAMAILYATDRGASAINLSVGALTGPELARQAAEYAHEAGVSLVGAAGDENAYHHNQPAMYDHFLYVHSIHPDTTEEYSGAYSYLNFFNCNNYGPRVTLSADTPACATGAAAITTGAVGLVLSAAKDAGLSLTPDEVYQLIIGGVDDIHLSAEEVEEANTYPSGEGWDPFFGYGRINVYSAVLAASKGEIPPEVDLRSPAWFETFDPSGSLSIEGSVAASRSAGVTWTIEYGLGWDPREWTSLATGTAAADGVLATLDLESIPETSVPEPEESEKILERVERVFKPAVTLRLRALDANGREAEYRKTVFVHRDPDLLPGFPLDLGESAESSPILTDLDGDGIFEVVLATSGGFVHAFTGDGGELPGFPVQTPVTRTWHSGQPAEASLGALHDGFVGTVAVGDLEGDGNPEIVAASGTGLVYAWHADGSEVSAFPVAIMGRDPDEFDTEHVYDNGFAGGPALYDLDGDGTLEIIAAAMDQRLYVWDYSGAPWGPYPIEVCDAAETCGVSGSRIIVTPAVGDVDGDGDVDIGLGTNETVQDGAASISYIYDANSATVLPGWPVRERGLVGYAGLLPVVGEGHPASMAFADLDGDGDLEISTSIMLGQSPLYAADGTVYKDISYFATDYGEDSNTSEPSLSTMSNNPAFGDMTGDGVPEFLIGGAGTNYLITLPLITARDWQHVTAAWDGATGRFLPGWPRQIEDLMFLVAPAVADLTGDGQAEAVFGSAGYLAYAWDAGGHLVEGWPKFTGNWMIGSPAIGDIDGDGYLEVVASTREGKVFAWRTRGAADQVVQWASMHHDPQNTGNWHTPLETQAGPVRLDWDGCYCGTARPFGLLAWLGGLGLAWSRRRR